MYACISVCHVAETVSMVDPGPSTASCPCITFPPTLRILLAFSLLTSIMLFVYARREKTRFSGKAEEKKQRMLPMPML